MTLTLDNTMNTALMALMLSAAVWTVMTSKTIRAAVGLSVTSAILCIQLFMMNAPVAGVFELSVCAGLITVVFMSTISLTKPLDDDEARDFRRTRFRKVAFLPFILAIAAVILQSRVIPLVHPALPPAPGTQATVQEVLWNARRFDLLGQILIILTGVFGVVVLFKTKRITEGDPKK